MKKPKNKAVCTIKKEELADELLAAREQIAALETRNSQLETMADDMQEAANYWHDASTRASQTNLQLNARVSYLEQANRLQAESLDAMRTNFLAEVMRVRNMAKFHKVDLAKALEL